MENKHTAEDLKILQALPLEVKIRKTQQRIKEWVDRYGVDGVYVSRSGGKDSDVLGDIVRKMYSDIPHVFVNTGLEYDSVRIHAKEECDTVLRPEMGFVEVIKRYGYPVIGKEIAQKVQEARSCPNGYSASAFQKNSDKNLKYPQYSLERYSYLLKAPFRISHKCCAVMKKSPAKKYEKQNERKAFIGTMAEESRVRKTRWLKNGCNAFNDKRPHSNPLSFWTEQDILHYILRYNVKIADVYGNVVYRDDDGMQYENPLFDSSMKLDTTGAKRTGCVFCMFGITQDKERFLKLKEVEPKKYDYVMRGGKFDDTGMWIPDKGLGYKFVIDWLNEHGNLGIKY